MDVVALSEIDAQRREAVHQRCSGGPMPPTTILPLPEPQLHALADGGGTRHEGRLLLSSHTGRTDDAGKAGTDLAHWPASPSSRPPATARRPSTS